MLAIKPTISGTQYKLEIPTFDDIQPSQSLHKGIHQRQIALPRDQAHECNHGPLSQNLRPRSKAPQRRTAKGCAERAPPYLPEGHAILRSQPYPINPSTLGQPIEVLMISWLKNVRDTGCRRETSLLAGRLLS